MINFDGQNWMECIIEDDERRTKMKTFFFWQTDQDRQDNLEKLSVCLCRHQTIDNARGSDS